MGEHILSRIVPMLSRVLSAALLLISAAGAAGAETGASLAGTVTVRGSGRGVVGATLRIEETGAETRTSESGRFRFEELLPGTYHLSLRVAADEEWMPRLRTIEIGASGGATTYSLTIEVPAATSTVHERITVVAQRHPSTLGNAPEAIRILEREELEAYAANDLTRAMHRVPGLQFYDVAGSPADPAVNVRGFTGGGENDYLLVLLDGVRINDLGTGRIDWRELQLADVERVEILRGPMSALYGDASVGGVIQIVTREAEGNELGVALFTGSDGELGGTFRFSDGLRSSDASRHRDAVGGARLGVSVGLTTADGWRQRSELEDLQAAVRVAGGDDRGWHLDLWLRQDEHQSPGPLSPDLLATAPELALYPFDRVQRDRLGFSWRHSRRAMGWEIESQFALRVQDDALVETLLIETKERRFRGEGLSGEGRARRRLGRGLLASLGVEASSASYGSDYFAVDGGGRRGMQSADGDGDRLGVGGFAQLEIAAAPRFEIQIGVRYDRVEDDFDEALLSGASASSSNDAISPRLGFVFQPTDGSSLYATLGGSFKAPTPFQLFDQRRPFGIPITNPQLEPLRGTSYAVGHRQRLGRHADLDVSLYWLELEDEIGFDPIAFRTDNLGRSRHRGVEVLVDSRLSAAWSALLSYTLTEARLRAGDFAGNRIDNVPRHATAVGLRYAAGPWTASLSLRDVRDLFLDAAETQRLDAYSTVDFGTKRRLRDFELELELLNLGDERYATWGFVSPLDGTPFLFPGLARSLRIGLRYRR